jgi:hypothetical protein
MTVRARLILAAGMTLTVALAVFAISANLSAFREDGQTSSPPVEIPAESTAFVVAEGVVDAAEAPGVDDAGQFVELLDSSEASGFEGDEAESEHDEDEEHDEYEEEDD